MLSDVFRGHGVLVTFFFEKKITLDQRMGRALLLAETHLS